MTANRAALAAVAAVAALALGACDPFGGLVPTDDDHSAPAISTSANPSTAPSAEPSASPSPEATGDPEGPVVSKPAGDPVTPEIFLATVDNEADTLSVVVYVPGIFEDGGTCTVTVKVGAGNVSRTNTGAADATATACGQFVFNLASLPAGTATVTASYLSAKHEGTSAPTEVVVP